MLPRGISFSRRVAKEEGDGAPTVLRIEEVDITINL
jgi:hypothetical protein